MNAISQFRATSSCQRSLPGRPLSGRAGGTSDLWLVDVGVAGRMLIPGTQVPRPPPKRPDEPAIPVIPIDPPSPLDADACIQAIALHRDREAFARLFSYFAPRVKSYLLRQGATPALAEDLAQESLLAVWRKAESFDPQRAGASTWIFTIARNLRVDALRRDHSPNAGRQGADDTTQDDRPSDEPGAEAVLVAREEEAGLRAALRSLPPDQALVVRLSFFRGLPHVEIGRELGIPLGTVKSRLRLAMTRLRTAMDQKP